MKHFFSIAWLLTFLISCGEQDPLTGYSDSVREAVPESVQLEKPPDIPVTLRALGH